MDSLTPAKKAQLQEVADLMLEIYRTLVRMRYLDASWICEGPHDIEALLPMYRSYGLDDSVIFLYSILPYIHTPGNSYDWAFFQGGKFADFRQEDDVRQGRDPLHECNEDKQLPPYMTPLSNLGNHHSVILYNASKHEVAIIDQESDTSTDHNLYQQLDETIEDDGWRGQSGMDGGEDEGYDTDEEMSSAGEEDGTDDDEYEDDDSNEEEGPWDEIDSRPAGHVLRDIVHWFHKLIEKPGDGDTTGDQWDPDLIEALYRKHGWPGPRFDGDAFLVDKARADAVRNAEWHPKYEVDVLKAELRSDAPDGAKYIEMKKAEAAAETVEDLWVARWSLFLPEARARGNAEALRVAEKKLDAVRERLSLEEVAYLGERLQSGKDALEKAEQELRDASPEKVAGAQIRHRWAKVQMETFQKGYEASRAHAHALFPGRVPPPPDRRAHHIIRYEERLQFLDRHIVPLQLETEAIRGWVAELPGGTERAGKLARDVLGFKEKNLEGLLKQRQVPAAALERYKSEEEEEVPA